MLKIGYKAQRIILIASFLFLPLLLLVVFSFVPLVNMIQYSFLRWDGISKSRPFIGWDNYTKIFTNKEYFVVFKTSIYYFIGSFLQMAIALYFATILSFKVKGKNFFKGAIFFPYLMNGVAIGFIFLLFFKIDGTLDTVLHFFHLDFLITKWLGNPKVINYSLAGTSIWRYIGFNFVVFMGAIQSISSEVYEAADIDGANKYQQFIHIIWPSIISIIELNLILSIKGALSVFEIPYIMTGGANGSKTFVISTVDTAFKFQKLGMGSAMAVVLFVIVIILTMVQKVLFKVKEDN